MTTEHAGLFTVVAVLLTIGSSTPSQAMGGGGKCWWGVVANPIGGAICFSSGESTQESSELWGLVGSQK